MSEQRMSEHVSIERMNEALDGLLSSSEREPLERHLVACALCRNDYARLSETVRAIAALPAEAHTPEGAWPRIAARIADGVGRGGGEAADDDVPVLRLPGTRRSARRLTLSIPQLAAAAAIVAVLSASLMWLAIGGGRVDDGTVGALVETGAPGGAAARAVAVESGRYAEVVGRLERILDEGRSVLTPETLVSIEESLATIDAAIAEIEIALADDPNSDLLRRMLANHRRTRLGVLQRAAQAVQTQT